MAYEVSIVIIATAISFFWAYLLWRSLKYYYGYWERRRIPQTRPTIPSGNMHDWTRSKHITEIFNRTYHEHYGRGPFVGFYLNAQKAAFVVDLNLAGEILTKNFDSFEHRGFFHNERDDPLTGNLFLLDGPKWHTLRTKLTPLFSGANIKFLFPAMLKVGEQLEMVLRQKVAESENGVFEMTTIMDNFAFDIIDSCVFGLDCNSLKDPDNPFCKMARKFLTVPRHISLVDTFINCFPQWAKRLRLKVIPTDVTKFFTATVYNTIKFREKYDIKNEDFLQLLIEMRNQMQEDGFEDNFTLEEMTAQAFGFFMNAFQSCSSTVSFMLYELAINQRIQNKVRQEIEQTLGRKPKLTFESLKKLKYLGQVISETLRKYPPMPALFRKCTKNFKPRLDQQFYIEKGCTVIIPTFCYHHDRNYFPNPVRFNPDRWGPENRKNIKPFSYLPFGNGPRNCLGMVFGRMEVRIALIMLIRNFKFTVCKETVHPLDILIDTYNLTPKSIILKLTKV